MKVRILCATASMPFGVQAWAERRQRKALVYLDGAYVRRGRVSAAGEQHVEAVLAALGLETTANGCTRRTARLRRRLK